MGEAMWLSEEGVCVEDDGNESQSRVPHDACEVLGGYYSHILRKFPESAISDGGPHQVNSGNAQLTALHVHDSGAPA